jgi:ligand-binding sensor domain-containing protein/two-component sensor histidine kinase
MCLLLSISTLKGFTQPKALTFEHLSVQQGLSHSLVESIQQDREGFMWFGTMVGLNKYDGYGFTVFNPDPKDPKNTLQDIHIFDIHEDHAGRLWVATTGLHLVDKRTGKITAYLADSIHFNYINVNVTIYEDKNGIIWTSVGGGLNRFDPAAKRLTTYQSPELVPNQGLVEDSNGRFWMGSTIGLFQFNPQTRKFTPFHIDSHAKANLSISTLCLDATGILWIGTKGNGVFQLNTKQSVPRAVPYNPGGHVNKWIARNGMIEDMNGYIWLATSEGLQCIDKKADRVTTYLSKPETPGSLSSNNILSVYQDRNGTLWVGTDNGVDKAIDNAKPFYTYQVSYNSQPVRIPENKINTLLEDENGIVWLGTSNGLYQYIPQEQQGKLILLNSGASEAIPSPADKTSQNIWISQIRKDQSGRLWIGTPSGLYLLNRSTGRSKLYPCNIPVQFIGQDSSGRFWIPGGDYTKKGNAVMAVFDLHELKFSYTEYRLDDPNGLKDMYLNGVIVSREGNIWIATQSNGISRMNPKTGTFTHYPPNYKSPQGYINDQNVYSLYEDDSGIIWAGTSKGGLNRLDPKNGGFTYFTMYEGLPGNQIGSISGDKNGNLWLGTNKGLSRFNIKTKTFRNFDIADGLPANEFTVGSVYSQNGKLLFGTVNGFVQFHPDSIKENRIVPPIYITGMKVLEKPRPLPESNLELPYNENFLAFDFVALNYNSPEKNQYAYQLVGLEPAWVYSGNRRYASYTGLRPGKYTFRVKASNNDGIWNEKGTSLTIIIHPPWWRTWWAYLLWAGIILAILYSIYYIRISRLKELLQVRNRIAHDLHDDVGSTLSSISIMSEMAKRRVPASSELLERIGSNAQQMQENMSDIVWAINPKNDRFEDVLQRMKMFASEMLEAKNITLHFNADAALYHLKLSMEQRRNLYFIFKEAITNAAKYAAAANVIVNVSLQNNLMELLVKDDGRGFDADYQTMGGNGLYNMQKRAEDLNGILKIDSIKGTGTNVYLQFKIT